MADEVQTGRWAEIAARISARGAIDIDEMCGKWDPRRNAVGRDIHVDNTVLPAPAMKREETVAVGVRVTAPPERPADLAMRLASLGLEKGIEVIVLSHLDYSGLEHFGFRVERISGATSETRAACEAQVCRFWNIELVI